MTQAELGRLVGAGQSAVHGWEACDFEPRPEVRERIAAALQTTFEALFLTPSIPETAAANG